MSDSAYSEPTIAAAFVDRGIFNYCRGKLEEAGADFTRAIQLKSESHSYFWRSVIQFELGQVRNALLDINSAIELKPEDQSCRKFRAKLYFELRDWDRALEDLENALAADPADDELRYSRANVLQARGDSARAIEEYNLLIQQWRPRAEYFAERAQAWTSLGEDAKAAADAQQAVLRRPTSSTYVVNFGRAQERLENYGQAIAHYKHSIHLEPDDPTGHEHLACLLAMCPVRAVRDAEEAVRFALRACELRSGNDWVSQSILAAAYAEAWQFEKALDLLDQTAALLPNAEEADSMASEYSFSLGLCTYGVANCKAARFDQALFAFELGLDRATYPSEKVALLNNLAFLFAVCPDPRIRDGRKAVEFATRAGEADHWKHWPAFANLAAAYAEVGKFDDAVRLAEQAHRIAPAIAKPERHSVIELYHSRHVWRGRP